MRFKLNKRNIVTLILWFVLFKIEAINQDTYYILSLLLLLAITPIVIKNMIKRGRINVVFGAFLIVIIISTYFFFGVGNHLLRASIFAYGLFSTYIILDEYVNEYGYISVCKILYKLSIIYIILTYVFMLINPTETTYFVGSKFKVVYLHVFAIMLWCVINDKKINSFDKKIIKEFIFLCLIIWGCIVSWRVEATTGIIAMISFFVFVHIPQQIGYKLQKPAVVMAIFFAINFLFVGSNIIMSSSWFNELVTNVFNESATLRGRIFIYDRIRRIISDKPFWGYGFESTIVYSEIGYGNAQNGLLKMLVDYGFIGTILFVLYMLKIKMNRLLSEKQGWAMWSFIYVMIICSLFEVSINSFFYLVLFLISVQNRNILNNKNEETSYENVRKKN